MKAPSHEDALEVTGVFVPLAAGAVAQSAKKRKQMKLERQLVVLGIRTWNQGRAR
jgi:hypothetical protein